MATVSLDDMSRLAQAMLDAEDEVAKAERKLSEAKAHLTTIAEETIPNAMKELGLKEFKLEDGTKISYKLEIYASLTAEKKSEAFHWLEQNNFGGLIKTNLTIEFGKEEIQKAKDLAAKLIAQGFMPELERSVHAQTLKAFLGEQIKAGNKDLPLDTFGARPVDKAKVALPKSSKK